MKRWRPDALDVSGADRRTRRDLIWECVALRHQLATRSLGANMVRWLQSEIDDWIKELSPARTAVMADDAA